MINSGDQQLSSGVSKFIARFDKLSATRMRPKLPSAFHQFGWEMGATTITQGGQLQHEKNFSTSYSSREEESSENPDILANTHLQVQKLTYP